jgi:[acyl-carrier-protein] S-malonyltransferase
MQAAADAAPGTVAAVLGLEQDEVGRVLAGRREVWAANDNAPAHVVVSGTPGGVDAAAAALKAAGARRALRCRSAAPSTPRSWSRRARLERALAAATWTSPAVTVLSAVTAQPADTDLPALLSRQLTAPVRWRETAQAPPRHGVDVVGEVGPGGVLAGLVKRCVPGLRTVSLAHPDDLEQL